MSDRAGYQARAIHGSEFYDAGWGDRKSEAYRRGVAELRDALKKAYDTLYSISCSRYGKGLTCTDDIHELVTMARECSDELYANENLRKVLEGAK